MRMGMKMRMRIRMTMRIKMIILVFLIYLQNFVVPFVNSSIVSFDFLRM